MSIFKCIVNPCFSVLLVLHYYHYFPAKFIRGGFTCMVWPMYLVPQRQVIPMFLQIHCTHACIFSQNIQPHTKAGLYPSPPTKMWLLHLTRISWAAPLVPRQNLIRFSYCSHSNMLTFTTAAATTKGMGCSAQSILFPSRMGEACLTCMSFCP